MDSSIIYNILIFNLKMDKNPPWNVMLCYGKIKAVVTMTHFLVSL